MRWNRHRVLGWGRAPLGSVVITVDNPPLVRTGVVAGPIAIGGADPFCFPCPCPLLLIGA